MVTLDAIYNEIFGPTSVIKLLAWKLEDPLDSGSRPAEVLPPPSHTQAPGIYMDGAKRHDSLALFIYIYIYKYMSVVL